VYPTLIEDLPAPRLRTYPVYTVVSEKLHAIALLGMTNARVKDYFDLWVLLDRESLNINTAGPGRRGNVRAAGYGGANRTARRSDR
jgi:hypothetical protein